jgi:TonB family protein
MKGCFRGIFLSIILCVYANASSFQGGKREPSSLPSPPTTANSRRVIARKRPVNNRPKADISRLADITLTVTPSDSIVWLNNEQMPEVEIDGSLSLVNLKPGAYVLAVRHVNYRDQLRSIDLKPGPNDPLSITLELLKGSLTVKPNIDGTSIDLKNLDRGESVGTYAGSIDQVDFPPGEYAVTISKPGYQPRTRQFTVKPDASLELEPELELVPTPTPSPSPAIASRSSVIFDGKYLEVRFQGTSGNVLSHAGSLHVTVNRATPMASVQGALNGLPCRIVLDDLQNVADWSMVESPSPSNSWALIAIRLRPKDSKQPISFSVVWTSLKNAPVEESPRQSDVVVRAVPIHRVVPSVPARALSLHIQGVVKVSVVVDEYGDVKSAKAFDGPGMLRQSAENAARDWRFKPAMRNGIPTQSTEIIHFTFEGY